MNGRLAPRSDRNRRRVLALAVWLAILTIGSVAFEACADESESKPVISPPVATQQIGPVCRERSELLGRLKAKYGEVPRAIGLSEDGGVLEITVAPGGGWTILVTHPRRPTCIVAVGQAFEFIKLGELM